MWPRGQPIGAHHDQLWEAASLHAELWGHDPPEISPSGDLARRMVEAFEHPSFGGRWRDIIRGHHRLASKEGSKMGRVLRLVFPMAREYNKDLPHKLDLNRVQEFIQAAPKLQRKAPKKDPQQERIDKETAKRREKEGEAWLKKMGWDKLSDKERVAAMAKHALKGGKGA